MQKMRTIRAAASEIKAIDPGTGLTEWFLRQLVTGGAIPSIRAGSKWLIDLQDVEKYIEREMTNGGRI